MSVIPPEETLKYINEARTNPKKFAEYVKKEIGTFIDNSQMPLYPGCYYATNEGKGAWTQAYNFLMSQNPLPPYILNQGLTLAAEDHAIDMAQTGIFGHNSSNGASFSDRITKRCGQSYGSSGQNIGSQFKVQGRNHALQTVLGLVIDDGVSSRGHRKNIFSKDFKYVGISSRVQGDKIITVIDFHSENVGTKNGTQNNNNAGNNLQYEKKGNQNQGQGNFDFGNEIGYGSGGSGGNFGFKQQGGGHFGAKFGGQFGGFNDGFGQNDGWGQPSNQVSTGGRRVISTSTNTKTQISNGVKKTVKITKKKYSDGTEEEEREETITS